MMRDLSNFDKVVDFHYKFGLDVAIEPKLPNESTKELRIKLLKEELDELVEAIENDDLEQIAKESSDLLYVTYGLQATYGIPSTAAFNRVHESNLTKLDENGKPVYNEYGKVVKGPNYKLADLSGLGLT